MSSENKQSRLHGDQVINKVLYPVTTVSLSVFDQVVRALTATGAYTITLPSVVEAKGKFYSLYMISRTGAEDITIQDKGDDSGLSDITFNLAADQVLLYSDGFLWHTVASSGL